MRLSTTPYATIFATLLLPLSGASSTQFVAVEDAWDDLDWHVTPLLIPGAKPARPLSETTFGDGRDTDVKTIAFSGDSEYLRLRIRLERLPPTGPECRGEVDWQLPRCAYFYTTTWTYLRQDGLRYGLEAALTVDCYETILPLVPEGPCGDWASVSKVLQGKHYTPRDASVTRIGPDTFEIALRKAYVTLWNGDDIGICAGDLFTNYGFRANSVQDHGVNYYFDYDHDADLAGPYTITSDGPGCGTGV